MIQQCGERRVAWAAGDTAGRMLLGTTSVGRDKELLSAGVGVDMLFIWHPGPADTFIAPSLWSPARPAPVLTSQPRLLLLPPLFLCLLTDSLSPFFSCCLSSSLSTAQPQVSPYPLSQSLPSPFSFSPYHFTAFSLTFSDFTLLSNILSLNFYFLLLPSMPSLPTLPSSYTYIALTLDLHTELLSPTFNLYPQLLSFHLHPQPLCLLLPPSLHIFCSLPSLVRWWWWCGGG